MRRRADSLPCRPRPCGTSDTYEADNDPLSLSDKGERTEVTETKGGDSEDENSEDENSENKGILKSEV